MNFRAAIRRFVDRWIPAEPQKRNAFDMGQASARLFGDFVGTNSAADARLFGSLERIRARSRESTRVDPYAKNWLRLWVNNIAGPNGFTLQMQVRNPDGSSDQLANSAIEYWWKTFSKRKHWSHNGRFSRASFTRLACKHWGRDGEFLIRIIRNSSLPMGITFQLIDPVYLDVGKQELLANGNVVRNGVEKDASGRHIAYYLWERNPGQMFDPGGQGRSVRHAAADEFGNPQILHFFIPDETESSRGEPETTAALGRLKQLDGFEQAALVASRAGACKMAFLQRTLEAGGDHTPDAEEDGQPISEAEPGAIEKLPPGWSINALDWKYPNTDHGQFTETILRGVAAGLGVSYAAVSADLSKANYSSLREGKLLDQDTWKALQQEYIDQIEETLFCEALKIALLKGVVKIGNSSLPASKLDKFCAPSFRGRRWAWVDPRAEVEAEEKAIALKIRTRSGVLADSASGENFEDIVRELAEEQQLMEDAGLTQAPAPAQKTFPNQAP